MVYIWIIYVSGWWYTYPPEKYESIGMIPMYGKIKSVPVTTNQYGLLHGKSYSKRIYTY